MKLVNRMGIGLMICGTFLYSAFPVGVIYGVDVVKNMDKLLALGFPFGFLLFGFLLLGIE